MSASPPPGLKQYRVTVRFGEKDIAGTVTVLAPTSRLAHFHAINQVRFEQKLAPNITLFATSEGTK